MYMLTGYKNGRDPAVLYYSAAACFASLVPEAAAQLLLQGDRFLANNDEIRQIMRDEFDYIGNLPLDVFSVFIDHMGDCDRTATELQSGSLLAARRAQAYAYIWTHFH